jgi:WD40 repeat protein
MGSADQHRQDVQSVSFLPGDHKIVSASDDMTVKLWDVASGGCLATLQGHRGKIWGVTVSPDGATIATASSDGTVKLWDPRPPSYTLTLPGETRQTGVSLAFTPDGRALVVARTPERATAAGHFWDDSREVRGFDPVTGGEVFHREFGRHADTWTTILTADCQFVAFANDKAGNFEFWEVATGSRLATVEGVLRGADQVSGRFVAVDRVGQSIRQVDVLTGRTVRVFDGTETLRCLSCSPSGRLITAGDDRTRLIILNAMTGGRETLDLHPGTPPRLPPVFSPDETMFAMYLGGNSPILLWDGRAREPVSRLAGHTDEIYGAAFSPDGKVLATGDQGGQVILWDVATRQMLAALEFPVEGCQRLRFSPDSRTLAFAGTEVKTGIPKVYVLTTTVPDDVIERP